MQVLTNQGNATSYAGKGSSVTRTKRGSNFSLSVRLGDTDAAKELSCLIRGGRYRRDDPALCARSGPGGDDQDRLPRLVQRRLLRYCRLSQNWCGDRARRSEQEQSREIRV